MQTHCVLCCSGLIQKRRTILRSGCSSGRAILRPSGRCCAMFTVDDPRLGVRALGLDFKNPIGLAAGYDKNGVAVRGLAALGFGHIEVGTVTGAPKRGMNARGWRAPEAERAGESNGLSEQWR